MQKKLINIELKSDWREKRGKGKMNEAYTQTQNK